MLVRITSNTSGQIIMFAEHLRRLFQLIGKECTAQGIFTTEQLPAAISALKQAAEEEKQALHETAQKAREKGIIEEELALSEEELLSGHAGINLGQRAHPLIQMMEWTLKEKGFILWEAERDF